MSPQPRYAVIGNPVEHSLSPQLFTWLFSELGIRTDYSRQLVLPEDLPNIIARLNRGDWQGLSVTLPHKEAVCGMLDELDSSAMRVRACNTVVRLPSGRLRGFNTDGAGLRLALQHAEADLSGAQVILLGAGGAARAAAFEVASAGARELTIANRTVERAERLVADLVKAGVASAVRAIPLEDEAISKALANASIAINCTSVGLLAPGQSPLPSVCHLRAGQTVLDMVYRPLQTSLLKRATAEGAKTVDGLWMLIFQAFEQLRLWTERQCSAEAAQRDRKR